MATTANKPVLSDSDSDWIANHNKQPLSEEGCTRGSFSPENQLAGTFCPRWENYSLLPQVGTSRTWIGAFSGIMTGPRKITPVEYCKQQEHRQHHPVNTRCTSGLDYITLHGYIISGMLPAHLHMWTYKAWTDLASDPFMNELSFATIQPALPLVQVAGRTRLTTHLIPHFICPGKRSEVAFQADVWTSFEASSPQTPSS